MTFLPNLQTLAVATCMMNAASGAQAQTAALDSAENITAVMDACIVIITAHDYDAEGQGVEIPWQRVTARVAGFAPEGDPARVSANVWSSSAFYNSFCDVLFDDAELSQTTFDTFMENRTAAVLDGQNGICVDGAFITAELNDASSQSAQQLGAQGHISLHNAKDYGENPCTE